MTGPGPPARQRRAQGHNPGGWTPGSLPELPSRSPRQSHSATVESRGFPWAPVGWPGWQRGGASGCGAARRSALPNPEPEEGPCWAGTGGGRGGGGGGGQGGRGCDREPGRAPPAPHTCLPLPEITGSRCLQRPCLLGRLPQEVTWDPGPPGATRAHPGLNQEAILSVVSYMENLVGDFGRAPEVPGDDGAVGGVPAGSVRAAQKLGAFLQEEDVQGLLDGRLVAPHHLREWAAVRLGPRGPGSDPGRDAGAGRVSEQGGRGVPG